MNENRQALLSIIIGIFLKIPCLLCASCGSDFFEPRIDGNGEIELVEGNTFAAWEVPSGRWSAKDGIITGDTGGKALNVPEWLYTKQRFADFIFTCELRLTDELKPNSGLYFRVNPIEFKWRNKPLYEAASGYEFDVVPGKYNGSLGDWYARPKLRVFPDRKIIERVFLENDWNRMTIRTRGNRIEYWLNGAQIIDYSDVDPEASREGMIGLQIHDNAVMKVELRKARILSLFL